MTKKQQNAGSDTKPISGLIFDIKRFAINDGPGIRTAFFFKGCPLRCQWCHNPESLMFAPELTYRVGFCISCGICVNTCHNKALRLNPDSGRIELNSEKCVSCGLCAEACPGEALKMAGRRITAAEILAEAEKDRVFYDNSGGGVTFSGGEPLAQIDFLCECLTLCRAAGLHTAVDTSCYCDSKKLDRVIELADMFLCDIKHTDSKKHKELTGVDNGSIMNNILRISQAGKAIIVRVPVIPGINDDQANLKATADFAAGLKTLVEIEYLPYNAGGIEKMNILLRK